MIGARGALRGKRVLEVGCGRAADNLAQNLGCRCACIRGLA
jgi:hypothetical protein